MDFFNYKRRCSSVVHVGNVPLGGDYPIRIQSMGNVSTMDTEAAVAQAIRIVDAGSDYVRFTAQGEREAHNLGDIRRALDEAGYHAPLVADIHFNPKAADAAASRVEAVRINPGNYVDKVKTFNHIDYTDDEYAEELEKIRDRFVPFLNICKEHHTAIRIGVNHGSLSDRIMSRYGDTPEGMVESCMEFLRICKTEHFDDVVISIKASNTVVMVKTVRLLVRTMDKEDMHYPLHLGVTEAGEGEDGRIKSAVGIGTLLAEGIGDTIRVSLSEEPEAEVPVARKLVEFTTRRIHAPRIEAMAAPGFDPITARRRLTRVTQNIGGTMVPVVVSDRRRLTDEGFDRRFMPDYVYIGKEDPDNYPDTFRLIVDASVWKERDHVFPCFSSEEREQLKRNTSPIRFLQLSLDDLDDSMLELLKKETGVVVILTTSHPNGLGEERAAFHRLLMANCEVPVIISRCYQETDNEDLSLKAATEFGALLLDGFGDGLMLHDEELPALLSDRLQFDILQAVRLRISKTEYVSCPSCGRTLYDIQDAIARIKEATSGLKGLKIAIMGCIVNGPGEMADADYGYVGAGRGEVNLYKGKKCVLKDIPQEDAVDRLVELIKENGDWPD